MAVTLKKLLIYNWHTLAEAGPLPIERVCFLAGQNGSGKSTILDALSFLCLVQSKGFNRASDGNTTRGKERRTLLGYARGLKSLASAEDVESGSKGRSKYCRPGATNTHVAAEFQSSKTGKTFVIGATIELKDYSESDVCEPVWWGVQGVCLEELSFKVDTSKGQVVASLQEIKACLPRGAFFQEHKNQTNMRRMLSQKDYFNLTDNLRGDAKAFGRWAYSIQNAVSYEKDSISDLNMFIHKHVMPYEKINISEFQELIERMNVLNDELRQITEQKSLLSGICNYAEEYIAAKKQVAVYDVATDYAKHSSLEESLERQNELCDKKEHEIIDLKSERNKVHSELRDAEAMKLRLQENFQGSAVQALKYKIQVCKDKISSISLQREKYQNSLTSIFRFSSDVNRLLNDNVIDVELVSKLQSADIKGEHEDLVNLISSLRSANNALFKKRSSLEVEEKASKSKLIEIEDTINALSNSLPPSPPCYAKVKEAIASAFAAAKIYDSPYFLCELLDYRDSTFAHAIESYMGVDLFSIYVSPENYNFAVQAYKDFCSTNPDVCNVGLIDTSYYLGRTVKVGAQTIASMFIPKNDLIGAYINDRYGCVGIVDDASISSSSWPSFIDVNGFCYRNHVYFRFKKSTFLIIGASAREAHLESCKKEQSILRYNLECIRDDLKVCVRCINQYDKVLLPFIANGHVDLGDIKGLQGLMDDLRKDEESLIQLEDTDERREYQVWEDKCKKLKDSYDKLNKKIDDKNIDLGQENKRHKDIQNELSALEDRMVDLQRNHISLYEDAVSEVMKRRNNSRRSLDCIAKELKSESTGIQSQMDEKDREMVLLQKEYAHRTASDVPHGGINTIATFQELLKNLNTSELPTTQQRLKLATDNTRRSYSETVLGQMHANYDAADKQRKQMNKILKGFVFGGRCYEFDVIKPAIGKEAMFQMIASPDNVGIKDNQISFDSMSFDDIFDETRAELFDKLASASESEQEVLLDYRNYCKFSMSVSSEDGSNKGDLADIVGLNSGSENQVPAYLIFAASLLSFYNRKRGVGLSVHDSDTVRFMLVDECFASMDERNSKQLVQMLSMDLGMQLVLAAPLDRYSTLAESVDSIWVMSDNKSQHLRYCDYFTQTRFLRKLDELGIVTETCEV